MILQLKVPSEGGLCNKSYPTYTVLGSQYKRLRDLVSKTQESQSKNLDLTIPMAGTTNWTCRDNNSLPIDIVSAQGPLIKLWEKCKILEKLQWKWKFLGSPNHIIWGFILTQISGRTHSDVHFLIRWLPDPTTISSLIGIHISWFIGLNLQHMGNWKARIKANSMVLMA